MPIWGWVIVAIACAAVVVLAVLLVLSRRRTAHLRERFGPEYERTLKTTGGRRDAESALAQREERRGQMSIRALPQASRKRYEEDWRLVQAQFVDDPKTAVAGADRMIQSVMREEGYPIEDFDRRAEDLSVDHPEVVENYREGHRLATMSAERGEAGTEDLRQAMQHYRTLFDELMSVGAER